MAALDMRALYYIALPIGVAPTGSLPVGESDATNRQYYVELVKANENCLNQNFTIISQKIAELEARLGSLENKV